MKRITVGLLFVFITSLHSFGQESQRFEVKVAGLDLVGEVNAVPGCRVLWKEERKLQKYLKEHPEVLGVKKTTTPAWNFVVGSQQAWWATNLSTNTEYQVPSTCRAVGTNAYYFVEDSLWNRGRVNQAQVDSTQVAFDSRTPASASKGIYQLDVETYGNPPDVDSDPKIIILILDIKDGLTGTGTFIGGYFFSLNELPDGTGGRRSNVAEIFYLDADPLNLSTASGLATAIRTTAHEFQHMIHWNYDTDEISFINEGCSEVAEVVVGYPVRSQADYVNNPDVPLLQWNSAIADYARAARWILYLWNQFPNDYLKKLVQSPLNEISGMNSAFAQYPTSRVFSDVFKDWTVANQLNDASVDSRFAYTYSGALLKPLAKTYVNPNTGLQTDAVSGLGADYITFSSGSNLSVTFNSASSAVIVRAIEVGSSTKRVVEVPLGSTFSEPGFGTTYNSITFVVLNSSTTTDAPYTYQATGTAGTQAIQLKYDDGVGYGTLGLSTNDTVAVYFDPVVGAVLDSIRIAFRQIGTINVGLWKYTGVIRPTPLGAVIVTQSTMTATAADTNSRNTTEATTKWVKKDLSSLNIPTDNSFVVAAILGAVPTAPGVMVAKTVHTGSPDHSYTFLTSQSPPNWFYLTADGGANVWLYMIRAYAHVVSTNAPTVATTSASQLTSTSATLNGTVNPNGVATTAWFEWGTSSALVTYSSTASQSIGSGTSVTPVTADLAGLSVGTTYYYRVAAQNSRGTVRGSITSFATLPAYPSVLSLTTTVDFPSASKASDYKVSDYRIVGLPGAGNNSVNSLLPGTQNRDWQVFWDNGASSNYLVPFDGSSEFRFSAGRAFWVVKKGPWNINSTVSSAPLNASSEVEVPLHSGWNLITNPFSSSIPWSRIQNANNTSEPIYSYTAGFNTSSSFDPYVGYYYFNDPNNPKSTLRIPYSSIFSGSLASSDVPDVSWRVHITFISGEITDRGASFGVSSKVSAGPNRLTFHRPRTVSSAPSVEFYRPSWDPDYPAFATDIRQEPQESEIWEINVWTTRGISSQLVFSGLRTIPTRFEVYLADQGRAKYFDLRKDSVYNFTPFSDLSKFKVIVGRGDAIRDALSSVLPKEFALENNFPNPFNPSTTISVDIPFETKIRLTIYDMLGREVKTLHSGSIEPGRHWFKWDARGEAGTKVSSAVYICRLSTSTGFSQIRKMILTK